jgi:predicted small integral membrane protein
MTFISLFVNLMLMRSVVSTGFEPDPGQFRYSTEIDRRLFIGILKV